MHLISRSRIISCMSVYIEYVLLDNLVINTLLLICVRNTLKIKTNRFRIFLSALFGTIVACVLPLFSLPNIVLIFLKIALGLIMLLIFAKFLRLKEYLFAFFLFIIYTLVLGGACIATLLLFGVSIEDLAGGSYDAIVPVGVILLIVGVYVHLLITVAKYLTRKKEMLPFLRSVELVINNKTLKFMAYLDSGNKLYDAKSGLPVIILSVNGLEKYYCKETIESLLLNQKAEGFSGVHAINYSTISGEAKKMIAFNAEKLSIFYQDKEYTTNKFVVGITYKKFNDAVNYDMLLSPSVM